MPHPTSILRYGQSVVTLLRTLIVCVLVSACQGQTTPEPIRVVLRGALEHGKPVSGELGPLESRWIFEGKREDQIALGFKTENAPLGASVTVLGPNDEAVARARAGRSGDFRFRLPVDGTYTVSIGPVTGSGTYSLTLNLAAPAPEATATPLLTPTSQPGGRRIAIGETQPGRIETGDAIDLWSFEGAAGQTISIRMESAEADPVLRLFAPDQSPLASDDNPDRRRIAVISGVILPRTGTYYVQTWGNGRTGDYTLSLQSGVMPPTATATHTPALPTPRATLPPTSTPTITPTVIATAQTGGQLQLGEPVRGVIAVPEQSDRFAVFGLAGAVISVGMFADEGSALIPAFEMYAPNGDRVAAVTAKDAVSGALFNGYTLPATGAYIIFARAGGGTGAYTLTVGESWTLREVGGGEAQPNRSYAGRLYRFADRETWIYDLPANATISVEAAAEQPTFNPVIEVVGPDGAQLAAVRGGAGGTARAEALTISRAGRYQVRVTAFRNESVGTYTLTTRLLNVEPTPTFAPIDATAQISVAQGEQYTYTFKAVSGDLVRIEARAVDPTRFDPVIELYGPSGRRIARADDIGPGNTDAVLQIALQDGAGEYRALIYGYARMAGEFALRVTVE